MFSLPRLTHSQLFFPHSDIQDTINRVRASDTLVSVSSTLVVGVTCMATNFDVFENLHASIVILDECSQVMTSVFSLSNWTNVSFTKIIDD